MRVIAVVVVLIWSVSVIAEIPGWYKRDIVNLIHGSQGIIIYKVKGVSLHSVNGTHYSYKIDTEIVEELKGVAPKGNCYFIHTEGEWKSPIKVGETRIAILNIEYTGECGTIEPGFGAPATEDYVSLFKSIITAGT
ncbi:hypothetical protein [Aliikangiella sp. IMCC44359]|uniref:hypothetical protein n=1 Tax=Aliikangiella sp. IMCC44359 TaxID=3459125 RepID=UPI00403B11DD